VAQEEISVDRLRGTLPFLRVDADADAVEDLPQADVEAEFHPRLFPMEGMRQPDEDGAIAGHFGSAVVSAQEEGEHVARLRVTRPQAKLH
jgi:hypothetical protein